VAIARLREFGFRYVCASRCKVREVWRDRGWLNATLRPQGPQQETLGHPELQQKQRPGIIAGDSRRRQLHEGCGAKEVMGVRYGVVLACKGLVRSSVAEHYFKASGSPDVVGEDLSYTDVCGAEVDLL
jgi:hypothetical protein